MEIIIASDLAPTEINSKMFQNDDIIHKKE